MPDTPKPPHVKAMVSYAWGGEEAPHHDERVNALVDQLIDNGIDVVYDRYDLRDGDDTNVFMEQVAARGDVKKVIAICTPKYVSKMNARQGGSGQEGMIMSPHVYAQLGGTTDADPSRERRFIPVIFDTHPNTSVEDPINRPTMFGSMKFINLSTPEAYDANFDQLMLFLLDRPARVRPPLGKVPEHLLADPAHAFPAHTQFQILRRALENGRATPAHWRDYLTQVTQSLESLKPAVQGEAPNWRFDGEVARQEIDRFTPVRNEFVQALQLGIRHGGLPADELHGFLESLTLISERLPERHRHQSTIMNSVVFGHVDFLVLELTLYMVAVLINETQVGTLNDLTEASYYVTSHRWNKHFGFPILRHIANESHFGEHVIKAQGQRWLNAVGGLLYERATLQGITREHLIQADLMLFLKTRLEPSQDVYFGKWWPTIGQFLESAATPELFRRFASRRTLTPWYPFFKQTEPSHINNAIQRAFPDGTLGESFDMRYRHLSPVTVFAPNTWGTVP